MCGLLARSPSSRPGAQGDRESLSAMGQVEGALSEIVLR